MKTFKDYTVDQRTDYQLFTELNFDLNEITQFIRLKLDAHRHSSQIDFHNDLVNVRTIFDQFIEILSNYENENKDTPNEDV